MALKFNGVEPTAIKYNGTDLTVLKYGTTAVWGKPFSLTIQAGANSTVTANRTSSPNQHANTGAVTSGGIVYYGDTLTITATPVSGYKLTKFTINGTEYASGGTSAVSQPITITGAVSVVTTTTPAAKEWHTVWTGSEALFLTRQNPTKQSVFDVNGKQTRITGYVSNERFDNINFNAVELSAESVVLVNEKREAGDWFYSISVNGKISTDGKIEMNGKSRGTNVSSGKREFYSIDVYITKIEQYY